MDFGNRISEKLKIGDQDECWPWNGCLTSGYGAIRINGKQHLVHRIMYETHKGKIPKGKEIDHLCRNRRCANPNHLEAVTHQENCKRGMNGKCRKPRPFCKYGHPLSGDNLKFRGKNRTYKICVICDNLKSKRYRARKKV